MISYKQRILTLGQGMKLISNGCRIGDIVVILILIPPSVAVSSAVLVSCGFFRVPSGHVGYISHRRHRHLNDASLKRQNVTMSGDLCPKARRSSRHPPIALPV